MACLPFGHASVVFSQSNIPAIMQAVLDATIRAGVVEQLPGSNFFACQAGKTIFDLILDFTRFEGDKTTFQLEDLFQVWPIQEILELAADCDGARFQSSVTF